MTLCLSPTATVGDLEDAIRQRCGLDKEERIRMGYGPKPLARPRQELWQGRMMKPRRSGCRMSLVMGFRTSEINIRLQLMILDC